MRAVYLNKNFVNNEAIQLEDDKAHHLINVVRLKKSEEILLLNGSGFSAKGSILEIGKKFVNIKVSDCQEHTRRMNLDLALVLPKKEAFEEILRIATEVGIRTIYPITGENSPMEFEIDTDRTKKILENSLEQSNNPFLVHIYEKQTLNSFLCSSACEVNTFFFDPSGKANSQRGPLAGEVIYLIGPEGGLSQNEIMLVQKVFKEVISFKTPILRAPQAVSFGAGLISTLLAN
jgi:16S rRNA (uracil1498-N3)-methyltransferase